MTRTSRLGRMNMTPEFLAQALRLDPDTNILRVEMERPDSWVTVWVTSPRLDPVPEGWEAPNVTLKELK